MKNLVLVTEKGFLQFLFNRRLIFNYLLLEKSYLNLAPELFYLVYLQF